MQKLSDTGDHAATLDAGTASGVATLPTWALAVTALLAMLVMWLVGFDNGQITGVLDSTGQYAHELFHDGRHLLGVPCH